MTESHAGASQNSTATVHTIMPACPRNVALILGVTGLVGRQLARALLLRRTGWRVHGVARNQLHDDGLTLSSSSVLDGDGNPAFSFVACDLLDAEETARKLSPLSRDVTHVFWVTWSSRFPLDTPECCAENAAMMTNVLDALLSGARVLRHIALQTGVKHYVSLLKPPPSGEPGDSTTGPRGEGDDYYYCYDEDSPRVPAEEGGRHNFYYVLEDMLRERLLSAAAVMEKPGRCISWSVHRPGLLLGSSLRACFNFVGSLCVYGAVCRRLGLPFVFGGERRCWEEPHLDISDARVVAEQQVWASTRKRGAGGGEAFNTVNGARFAWREVWPTLAAKFVGADQGRQYLQAARSGEELFSASFTYESFMTDKGTVWEEVVESEGLRRTRAEELACWPFLDSVFRCPAQMLVRRPGRAEALGFDGERRVCGDAGGAPLECILFWVDRMRAERLVP